MAAVRLRGVRADVEDGNNVLSATVSSASTFLSTAAAVFLLDGVFAAVGVFGAEGFFVVGVDGFGATTVTVRFRADGVFVTTTAAATGSSERLGQIKSY